jgi:hypothetical protein
VAVERAEDPEALLFAGEVEGLILSCFENERPLQGLAGRLDWRLRGMLSHFLKAGSITGKPGECCYVPVRWHEQTFHLFLAGGGHLEEGNERPALPAESWDRLKKNLSTLKISKLAASSSDLGGIEAAVLKKKLSGMEVRLTP